MNTFREPGFRLTVLPFSFSDNLPGTQAILDAIPDAIIVVQGGGLISAVNARAVTVFGYQAEELIGEAMEILLPPRLSEAHARQREGFSRNPHARPMGEGQDLIARRKDGGEFYVDVALSPVKTPAGTAVVATVRDASARKKFELGLKNLNEQLEARVVQRTRELQAANRQLEFFSYAVGHELRSPLRIILGCTQMLLDSHASGIDTESDNCLNTTLRTANRMSEIINDLLRVARINHESLSIAEINVSDLVRQIGHDLVERERPRNVSFIIEELPVAHANAGLLGEVVTNLLANALKYSRSRSPAIIVVSGRCTAAEVVFEVRDNGIGFDEATAAKLFEPFQRLPSAAQIEGSGLGLYITRSIVERHGGRVWASGELDGGAVFGFSLPTPSSTEF